ncbi:MAG: hypothetical protein JO130_19990 [Solirubrobacterales bacterium]|nr:hypothetical protein [Solirubrobacterales bacterium]
MTATASPRYQQLRDFADRYLDALEHRAPYELPISHGLKVTENAQRIALGTGLWRTVRGLRDGGQYFVDVEREQVAFWGVIEEIRGEALYGVRLKVESRLITEIESLLVRGGDYFEPDVIVADSPEMHAVVPSEERLTRAELEAMATTYFDSIEQLTGDLIPAREGMVRLVNGTSDSNVTRPRLSEREQYLALDVSSQITEKHFHYIESIRDRRFSILDEERGIAHCMVMFDHPGDIEKPANGILFGAPNSMLCFEVFKASKLGLLEVWAIGTALPFGCPSGWS